MMSNNHGPLNNLRNDDRRQTYANTRKAVRRTSKGLSYEEWMFNWHPEYLTVIVTLNYEEAYRPLVALQDILDDRNRLLNNCESNSILNGILGYIVDIEFGDRGGGLHMHCIFFYSVDASRWLRMNDVEIAAAIGDYWSNFVTRGRGKAFNSNAKMSRATYTKYGNATGLVARGDTVKRTSLRLYIEDYLTKDDQHIFNNPNPNSHLFVTGRVPDWAKISTRGIDTSI